MTVLAQPIEIKRDISLLKDIGLGLLGSLIIGLFAHAALPLPFTPVPITFQPHVVLLLSAVLGRRAALIMVAAFLTEGAMGLPVFANGAFGVQHFFGPTGGYLLGYLLSAFVTGYLMERFKKKSELNAFYAMGIGSLVILGTGMLHLSAFIGMKSAFIFGVLPFLAGDIVKLILSVKCLKFFKGLSN